MDRSNEGKAPTRAVRSGMTRKGQSCLQPSRLRRMLRQVHRPRHSTYCGGFWRWPRRSMNGAMTEMARSATSKVHSLPPAGLCLVLSSRQICTQSAVEDKPWLISADAVHHLCRLGSSRQELCGSKLKFDTIACSAGQNIGSQTSASALHRAN